MYQNYKNEIHVKKNEDICLSPGNLLKQVLGKNKASGKCDVLTSH